MIQTLITDYFYPLNNKQNKNKQKQLLIIDYYSKIDNSLEISKKKRKKVYGYNSESGSWHCMECGIDMGSSNPRQLCRKFFCENIF